MEVGFCAVKNRAVSNRNGVAARRGGEQRNENDQSVTQTTQAGGRGELDAVGVDGRAFERVAKPVGAGVNPLAAGRSPVVAPRVGDGMAGSPSAIIRETRRGQAAFMAKSPKEPPGGSQSVRSSDEAGNDRLPVPHGRQVERRDAGKWMRDEPEQRTTPGASGGNA